MEKLNLYTSNFSKFFVGFLLPVIVLSILFSVVFYLWFEPAVMLSSETSGSYKYKKICQTDRNDIPILGSSRGETAFLPSLIHPQAFNYSRSGTGFNVELFMMEKELKCSKSTPIILNIDPWGMTSDIGDIADYLIIADDPEVKKLLGDQYKSYFQIPIVRYYGKTGGYLASFFREKTGATKLIDRGAEVEKRELASEMFADNVEKRKNEYSSFQLDTTLFNRFFDLAGSTNRTLILVVSPIHQAFYEHHDDSNYLLFITECAKHPNITLFDFSKKSYPDSLFFDSSHLNYCGAEQFSKEFRDSLRVLNLLSESLEQTKIFNSYN